MEFTTAPTPGLVAAFLASLGGIAFVILSRNAGVKRMVLPVTLLVFSGVWFEIFRRATESSFAVLLLVGVGLLANAIWVTRSLAYCATCGRTVQRAPVDRPPHCPECSASV